MQAGGSHCPRMLGPLTGTGSEPAIPEQLAPLRRIVGLARREGKGYGCSSIRGNHMNLGGAAAPGLADGLRSVFFNGPGCTLTMVLSSSRLQFDAHYLFSLQVFEHPVEHRPPVHSSVYSVPVAKPAGQPPPLAPLLGDIQGVQTLAGWTASRCHAEQGRLELCVRTELL